MWEGSAISIGVLPDFTANWDMGFLSCRRTYRVAPEDPYPAALEDVAEAFDWLLENGWSEEKIVVAGDSAGGGLGHGALHVSERPGAEAAGGDCGHVPWTDLTQSGASYRFNFRKDPVFGKTLDSLIFNRDYIGTNDPTDPYISPLLRKF